MPILSDKADFTGHMVGTLMARCQLSKKRIDSMRLIQLLAGIVVETVMLFDDPDKGLEAVYIQLAALSGCKPVEGVLHSKILPPPYLIDRETEQGRVMARGLFEEWLHCPHEFLDLCLFTAAHFFVAMEEDGYARSETFRIFQECADRCLAYEIAAQELCEVVIEQKIGVEGWSLSESISGLSAVAGRSLALSFSGEQLSLFRGSDLPEHLDKVAYVMTQEAIRHGIPAGSDWRFGLAANDQPNSAPYELIAALEPACREFFAHINLTGMVDQSVATAKAAGRMLAMASGGERPEIEPVIAKPLAMAAMTETYKIVCREYAIA